MGVVRGDRVLLCVWLEEIGYCWVWVVRGDRGLLGGGG